MSGFSEGTDTSTDSIRIYPLEANHTLHDSSRNNRSVVKFANDVNAVNNAHSVKAKKNSVGASSVNFPPILKGDAKSSNAKSEDDEEGEFSKNESLNDPPEECSELAQVGLGMAFWRWVEFGTGVVWFSEFSLSLVFDTFLCSPVVL